MPKIAYISPKILIDKVSKLVKEKWVNGSEQTQKGTTEAKPNKKAQASIEEETSLPDWAKLGDTSELVPELQDSTDSTDAQEEDTRFQISLQDLKTMHTSLVHFQKYLKAKGQTQRAQEVAALHEKVDGFIRIQESLGE